jgi:hypothetical protein
LRVVVLEDCLLLSGAQRLLALLRHEPVPRVKLLSALFQDASEQLQELRRLVSQPG